MSALPRTAAAPHLPLAGRRVLITRPAAQAGKLIGALEALGASPVLRPAIEIRALEETVELDAALRRLASYDWVVFTSANGVTHAWRRMDELGIDGAVLENERERWSGVAPADSRRKPRIAAIGPGTASALEVRGVSADYVPEEYVAESLARGLPQAEGSSVLLLRADIARPALRALLEERGARVEDVAAYRTVAASAHERDTSGRRENPPRITATEDLDAVTFTSPSTVRAFLRSGALVPPRAVVACIGPITARAAREMGLEVDAVARSYTIEGLVTALVEHFQERTTNA